MSSCCHQEGPSKYRHVNLIRKLIKWNWKRRFFFTCIILLLVKVQNYTTTYIFIVFICGTSIQGDLKIIATSHQVASGKYVSFHAQGAHHQHFFLLALLERGIKRNGHVCTHSLVQAETRRPCRNTRTVGSISGYRWAQHPTASFISGMKAAV